ncbi:hypothetical protein DPMN_174008 [Dreissena polymorpha]|uniref:Uncharacterized protein n=1 Tax=Dreissena polymorpha TaxID=45954 RepID=A0A9D4E3V0_DREPO|nr:hypothetical protein DPMN_174008 [Dreissena polymorpha]
MSKFLDSEPVYLPFEDITSSSSADHWFTDVTVTWPVKGHVIRGDCHTSGEGSKSKSKNLLSHASNRAEKPT